MIDVARARADTPGVKNRIHFNNCGAALMPGPVLEVLRTHLEREGAIGGYEAAAEAHERCEQTYDAIGALLNCRRHEIAVVENATRGWDMLFYGLPLKSGDRVLTSTAEYASNFIPFLQVARQRGVCIDVVPDDADGQLDVAALERMIDDRVRLIAVTHVPTNGGLVNPAGAIGAVARRHDIPFLLDACQSVGQMALDVDVLQVDMLSATSRKYLRGPRGVGFIYVRESWIERIEPPLLDVYAATWTSAGGYTVRKDARRFENWERNVAGGLALGEAVRYAMGWGLDAIEQRVGALAAQLRRELLDIDGVQVHDRGARLCGIVSFTMAGIDADRVVAHLAAHDINCSVSRAPSTLLDMQGRGLDAVVRAGLHYYNTESEIAQFVNVLKSVR